MSGGIKINLSILLYWKANLVRLIEVEVHVMPWRALRNCHFWQRMTSPWWRPPWRRAVAQTCMHVPSHVFARIRVCVCTCGACGANKTLQGKWADAINFSRAIEGVAVLASPLHPTSSSLLASLSRFRQTNIYKRWNELREACSGGAS